MKVFLTQDVAGIGKAGEIKEVASGYARNCLIPNSMGIEASTVNEKKIQNLLLKNKAKEQKIEKTTTELFDKLDKVVVTMEERTHQDGILYGAITPACIAKVLKERGLVTVNDNQITIPEDEKKIKKIGSYLISVKLSNKLQPKFILKITAAK